MSTPRRPRRWTWRRVHTWAGIGAGIFLLLTSLTGVVLGFRTSLKLPDPEVPEALQAAPPLPPMEIVARAEALAGARATELYFSGGPDEPWCVVLDDDRATEIWLSPGGEVLDTRHGVERGLTGWLFDLHTGAFLGRGGELAMTTAGGALVLLVLTGVVIWPWRQRRAKRGG